jgi:hypothetical protein
MMEVPTMSISRPKWVVWAGVTCWVIGIPSTLRSVSLLLQSQPPSRDTIEALARVWGSWHPFIVAVRFYYVLLAVYLAHGILLVVAGYGLLAMGSWGRRAFELSAWLTLLLAVYYATWMVGAKGAPEPTEPGDIVFDPYVSMVVFLGVAAVLTLLIRFLRSRSVRATFALRGSPEKGNLTAA